jgi:flagellum-specific ATP synthase
MNPLSPYIDAIRGAPMLREVGYVRQITGLSIEADGPEVGVGALCRIQKKGAADPRRDAGVLAEVVGVKPGSITLMPYGPVDGLAAGCEVVARGELARIGVGDALLGRIIDGFGNPLDGGPMPRVSSYRPLRAAPVNPMRRPRISRVIETGVRTIDGLLTLGQGQRVGIFAGSGVGKSTLLGMIVRHIQADVRVIALIGERGREVREFIEKQLGPEAMRSTVVVAATADQPALARIRASHAALAIAEHFRDSGRQVLLTMDSVTRFAMARREVGLAAGEPPTARGYTPSVFAELPELCERCGTGESGGAITALFTVLVDGDDLNEPISDTLRAVLDGHIVLSRQIAHRGQYPAIDVLKSASRVMPDLVTPEEEALAQETVSQLALLERNRQMVDMGAYEKGSSEQLDRALALDPALQAWLRQREGGVARAAALAELAAIVRTAGQGAR